MKVLERFKGGKMIDVDLREEIDEFFEYYWTKDKNYARKAPEGQRFLDELPQHVITKLYKDFLFKDFLYMFKKYFTFYNPLFDKRKQSDIKAHKNEIYVMGEDENFTYFMNYILQRLDPRIFYPEEMIHQVGTNVYEVIFVEQGQYGVGYMVGREMVFAKKFKSRTVIGDWEVFNHK
jgi:hypothetical protein